jgi:hypothetical protein
MGYVVTQRLEDQGKASSWRVSVHQLIVVVIVRSSSNIVHQVKVGSIVHIHDGGKSRCDLSKGPYIT